MLILLSCPTLQPLTPDQLDYQITSCLACNDKGYFVRSLWATESVVHGYPSRHATFAVADRRDVSVIKNRLRSLKPNYNPLIGF
jgi:hypothetical protein